MRALVFDRYGSADQLRFDDVPVPDLAPGNVRIRVHAVAVNDWDTAILSGKGLVTRLGEGLFRPRRRILGLDIAGTVEAIGPEVATVRVGDRVCGDISGAGFGGFAEYVTVPVSEVISIPDGVDDVTAAAIPHAGALAVQAIRAAAWAPGDRVLVNGAGGGVGMTVISRARRDGITSIVGVDSAAKASALRDAGCTDVLDYRAVDISRTGEKYDVVIDTRTTRRPSDYRRMLNNGGRYVTVGGLNGRLARIALTGGRAHRQTGARLILIVLSPNEGTSSLLADAAQGIWTPRIDSVWPWERARDAVAHYASAKHVGKVVIRVKPE